MLKNNIVNYFISKQLNKKKMPRVFRSSVTINSSVAKEIANYQLKNLKHDKLSTDSLLQVCFDSGSKRIYLPNATEFTKDDLEYLITATKLRINKDFGDFSSLPIIYGSPYSLIRVRNIDSFPYAFESIKKQFGEGSDLIIRSLPVIEVNMARMPSLRNRLPDSLRREKSFSGGYISEKFCNLMNFSEEVNINGKVLKESIPLLNQQAPFILINLASETKMDFSMKEAIVLGGIHDFIVDNVSIEKDLDNKDLEDSVKEFNFISKAKYYMYLGWTFEEVCSLMLSYIGNFISFIKGGQLLVKAAQSLAEEGYKNPIDINYYMTFKIKKDKFVLNLDSVSTNGKFDINKQIDCFKVLDYDKENEFVVIETPIYITPTTCRCLLKCESEPLITKYNPAMKTIDVKSNGTIYKDITRNNKKQISKIFALTSYNANKIDKDFDKGKLSFRANDDATGVGYSNYDVFHIRHISDYCYAVDNIKNIINEYNKNNEIKFEFKDIVVLIGPMEKLFGRGTQGGFMDEALYKKNKLKIPHEILPGIFLSPPTIFIDSKNNPSPASQTSILIHEYSHNIFSITNPEHHHTYHDDPNLKDKDSNKWWFLYLTDEDERQAHKNEVKFLFKSGLSPDEIIREKVGGAITVDNYGIAMKFKELVDEVAITL